MGNFMDGRCGVIDAVNILLEGHVTEKSGSLR